MDREKKDFTDENLDIQNEVEDLIFKTDWMLDYLKELVECNNLQQPKDLQIEGLKCKEKNHV